MPDNRKIALTIHANSAQLRADLRRASGDVRQFGREVDTLGAKLRNMRMRFQQSGIFGRGGGALRTAAGFAGIFGMQQMIMDAKEGNAALTDIAITGNLTDSQLQDLRKTIHEVSNATAKSTSELTRFVATVTTMTGDAAGAKEALADMGEVMVATGTSGEALAGVYVKLTTTMGLLPKQAKEAFNVMRAQEKLGSVTMANIATNFSKILGPASVFGAEAKGIKGVRTLGGLYQIAQRGFAVGQEGEAATSAGSFLGFLGRRAKQVRKVFGVDVFDKSGKARDLPTVLEELGRSFVANNEALRTKGQLIFGRAGIRTAFQLADAARAPGGFAGKVGAYASANELLRGAGGTDVIGSDAARRRASAAYQFDEQLNIFKNSVKKHITPLFKTLASTLKEVGPDLVRILKFALEHSKQLFQLWLGYKGVTFFKRLMAPVQASAGGAGMASATGMAAMNLGGGGGALMLPDGRMVSAARGGNFFPGGVGWGGQWVQGFGPQHVWTTDAKMLARERSLGGRLGRGIGRAGAWMGMMGRQYGGTVGRFGGQALGVAGMMGFGHDYGPAGAGMAANMALMSGNPYLMLAGGAYKASNELVHYTSRRGQYGERVDRKEWYMQAAQATGGLLTQYLRQEAAKVDLGKYVQAHLSKNGLMPGDREKIDAGLSKFYSETGLGAGHRKEASRLLSQFGGYIGEGGVMGISPEQRVALARGGSGAVASLRNSIGRQRDIARFKTMELLGDKTAGKSKDEVEAMLEQANPLYAKLNDLFSALDKLVADITNGKKITVNVVQPSGTTPGQRVENAAKPKETKE